MAPRLALWRLAQAAGSAHRCPLARDDNLVTRGRKIWAELGVLDNRGARRSLLIILAETSPLVICARYVLHVVILTSAISWRCCAPVGARCGGVCGGGSHVSARRRRRTPVAGPVIGHEPKPMCDRGRQQWSGRLTDVRYPVMPYHGQAAVRPTGVRDVHPRAIARHHLGLGDHALSLGPRRRSATASPNGHCPRGPRGTTSASLVKDISRPTPATPALHKAGSRLVGTGANSTGRPRKARHQRAPPGRRGRLGARGL